MNPREEPGPTKPQATRSLKIGGNGTGTGSSYASSSSGELSSQPSASTYYAPATTSASSICTSCGKIPAEIEPIKSEHSPIVKEVIVPTIREEVTPEIYRERGLLPNRVHFLPFLLISLFPSFLLPCLRDAVREVRCSADQRKGDRANSY